MADMWYFDSRPKLRHVPIQSVRGNSRASELLYHWCGSSSVHIVWVNCEFCERKTAKWLIKCCTVRMCCKCYSPILTLKGNICGLEMTIGRLMLALLPVHLCCAMVPPGKAREFTKHKQVIISALCPTGMGVAGVDVVLVSIGEALRCWWSPQIASFKLTDCTCQCQIDIKHWHKKTGQKC